MKRPDPHEPDSLTRVRTMRHNPTEPEKRLWSKLRSRQLNGVKFRRQVWIGHYIADFISVEARLIIEVDGDSHALTQEQDARRTAFLHMQGFQVLRFANTDVMTNVDGVVERIMAQLKGNPAPSHAAQPGGPRPLPQGERGQ